MAEELNGLILCVVLQLCKVVTLACDVSFKDAHQVSVPFCFHFVVGNEPQRCTIDAVPDSVGGFGIVFKDMAQVGVTSPTSHLNALHSMAVVTLYARNSSGTGTMRETTALLDLR